MEEVTQEHQGAVQVIMAQQILVVVAVVLLTMDLLHPVVEQAALA